MPHINKTRTCAAFILTLFVTFFGLMNWQPASSHSTPSSCPTPTFTIPTNFAVGPQPYSVAVGDFNGDGISDLVTSNRQTNNPIDPRGVSVLLGTGAGSFGVAGHFAVAAHHPPIIFSNPEPPSVTTGDFNGDGKSDIVTANTNSRDVSVLLSLGGGDFQDSQQFSVGLRPVSVGVGDFNDDGNDDLVTANQSAPGVSVLFGNGTGSFGAPFNITLGNGPNSVATGDFNLDGNDDLAVGDSVTGNVSILISTGSGNFGTATNYSVGQPLSVAVSDFNSDGYSDLAVARFFGGVSILLGTGTGTFGVPTNYSTLSSPYSVAVGDFNGDDKADLATVDASDYNVSVLLGTGSGGFGVLTKFVLPMGSSPRSVTTGDFNRDGVSDMATANSGSNSVSVLLSTCISSDTTPPVLTVPSTIAVPSTTPTGAVVTYTVTATDNVDPNPVVSCSPQSGTTFPIGTTSVNCTATDASGNVASDSFTVVVTQSPPPTCVPTPDPVPLPLAPLPLGGIRRAMVMGQSHDSGGYGHLLYQPNQEVIQHNPDAKPNIDIIVDSGSKWVRLWADWPKYQPSDPPQPPTNPFPNIVDLEDSCSALYIERDPRTSAVIQSLDQQIMLARSRGLRVILTSHRFPSWATFPKSLFALHPEFVVPDDVGVNSPTGKWIKFLVKRYGYSQTTSPTGRYVDFLEVTNEPNLTMIPQRGMPKKIAQMFKTAQTIVRDNGNTLRLAGPGTADIDHSVCQQDRPRTRAGTNYVEFTEELLKQLRLTGFVADENFAWTHHNYRDIECDKDGVARRKLRKADFPVVNSAAWVRWMIVAGDSRYKWQGWPDRVHPQILITEGGARLDGLLNKYHDLLDNDPVKQIRKQQQKQKYLVSENFLRMAGQRDVRLGNGIAMVSSYLTYTDPAFDSGLLDFVGLCRIPISTWTCETLPPDSAPIWKCRSASVCTGEWGKRRLAYDKWKSLSSGP